VKRNMLAVWLLIKSVVMFPAMFAWGWHETWVAEYTKPEPKMLNAAFHMFCLMILLSFYGSLAIATSTISFVRDEWCFGAWFAVATVGITHWFYMVLGPHGIDALGLARKVPEWVAGKVGGVWKDAQAAADAIIEEEEKRKAQNGDVSIVDDAPAGEGDLSMQDEVSA